MTVLLTQRCLHHPVREAVARCPECGQFFCRECITEHDDRVICSSCLRKLTTKKETKRRSFAPLGRALAAVAGLFIAWIFFFIIGRLLVNIPSDFHEGTVWKRDLEEALEAEP
jgi:uncharacterized paraquat-inducible protein A